MSLFRLLCLAGCAMLSGLPLPAQNDIQIIGDPVLTPAEIAEGASVLYLIRFQNVGVETVTQVVIRDTLDPRLDAGSMVMVASSHQDYNIIRDGSNILRWYFEDILLPDSTANNSASHGFVLFSVRPQNGLAPGQVIANAASIEFDGAYSIATNQAYLWIDDNAHTDEPGLAPALQIVPNPNYGYFSVRNSNNGSGNAPAKQTNWWITDINGKTIWDGRAESPSTVGAEISLSRPNPGIYFLWVQSPSGLAVEQFSVIH